MPLRIDPLTNLRSTLSVYRYGRADPTTRLGTSEFVRATLTPDGPATLRMCWSRDQLVAEAWGPGAEWMLARAPQFAGGCDPGWTFGDDSHPHVQRAQRNHPGIRFGASGSLYHELLPVILGQRVTGVEAFSQWRRLVQRLGDPAPGPFPDLRLPPSPQRLLAHPPWWFHPIGIEAKRAEAMRTIARYASRIQQWNDLSPSDAASRLRLLPGIGAWTIGSAVGPALGDPDAVPVGDYHIPNMVSWALAGEPRGSDARMLDLLEPYVGQRGRVIRLLGLDGHAAPKFGPRQRIQPMYRR
ncbi:MAG: DNA-3-methyladenine glycosylase 2 family protein [Ilumatobacteraceae bacterium]